MELIPKSFFRYVLHIQVCVTVNFGVCIHAYCFAKVAFDEIWYLKPLIPRDDVDNHGTLTQNTHPN